MENKREQRYVDKINHIEKRIENFEEWKDSFLLDEKTKLACYKAMQEIIEACMDMVTMMLKDLGEIPKDDYTNIVLLEKKSIVTPSISASLRELNGLRNRIVHEYNGLIDEIALESFEELIPEIKKFIGVVREWLKKKS